MMRMRSVVAGRRIASGVRLDEGFTFVEIMIALSLLLIALTGLIALVAGSTTSGVMARQRAVMVNATSTYLEKVRQSPFDNVGTPGGDPSGDLVPESMTNASFYVVITPTVTWGRAEDPSNHEYKTVTLDVTASKPGAGTYTYSMSSVVGRWGLGTGPASVRIQSPSNGTVLTAMSIVPVNMVAATNSQKRDLLGVKLYDGQILLGTAAVQGKNDSAVINWSPTGEGFHGIWAQVEDDGPTSSKSETRRILLDLLAPAWPSNVFGMGSSSPRDTSGSFWWNPATDGLLEDRLTAAEADHYHLNLRLQPVTGSEADISGWTSVKTQVIAAPAPAASNPLTWSDLVPFSRYGLQVQASSPDRSGSNGLMSTAVPTTFLVTRANAEATCTLRWTSYWAYEVQAAIPNGPTFPWVGDAVTQWYMCPHPLDSITWPNYFTLLGGTSWVAVGPAIVSTYPTWRSDPVVMTAPYTCAQLANPHPVTLVAITTLTPNGVGAVSRAVATGVLGHNSYALTSAVNGVPQPLVLKGW